MRLPILIVLLILLLTVPGAAQDANEHEHHQQGHGGLNVERPDGHAPIGVMGDHLHHEGGWMVSYRGRAMHMEGNRDGTAGVSPQQVLRTYPVTPTQMSTQMHTVGLMYAPSDQVTAVLMIPYVRKSMDHLTRRGMSFTTSSEGLGDVRVGALVGLYNADGHEVHFNAGLSLPTGQIDARDTTPMGPGQLLPYPMQLGSGTVDLVPGVTYVGQSEEWSWGAQGLATVRLGTNTRGYRLGNRGELSLWGAHRWSDAVSTSVRLHGQTWGDIGGADPGLNPGMVPTADPGLRAGNRVDLLLGLNLYAPEGSALSGHRLAIEGGVPIHQSLTGPQLGTDWILTGGWQFSF